VDSPVSYRISVPGSTQVSSGRRQVFAYGAVTLSGRLSHTFPLTFRFLTPICRTLQPLLFAGLGFSLFARHYSGNDLFSSGYLDVSVPQVPFPILYIQIGMPLVRNGGFPHSDIPGSTPVHGYPRLFAVSHVLRRHLAPRHPP
jgi:hypothetical protein